MDFLSGASGALGLPIVEGSWSGSAARRAVAKWASSDGSGKKDTINWSKYRRAFFWYDASNPENFGSYKLPFATVRNGRLVAVKAGITAAAAAVQGARGGVSIPEKDKAAVKRRIASYYRRMKMEPPWGNKKDE